MQIDILRTVSIGKRAVIVFSITLFVNLFLGVFGYIQINNLFKEVEEITNIRVEAIVESDELIISFLSIKSNLLLLINKDSILQNDAVTYSINKDIDRMGANYKKIEELKLSTVALNNIKSSKVYFEKYTSGIRKIESFVKSGEYEEAIKYRSQFLSSISDEFQRAIFKIKDKQYYYALESKKNADKIYSESVYSISLVIFFSLLLNTVIGWFFTKSITNPIYQVVKFSKKISKGDLTTIIDNRGSDEASEMISSLLEMQKNLSHILQEISNSSDQLAATSEELSVITEESTNNIENQNQQLNMAHTAVTEMSLSIELVAISAQNASDNSDIANEESKLGHKKVEQTLITINELVNDIKLSSNGVNSLALKVNDISSVLDVIRGIAEQTNLLALNAAIEAARAGDTGRGFAVVADEVRTLAHRTQESTKKIETMIGAIKDETNKTVKAMSDSEEQAIDTLAISNDAGNAIKLITDAVTKIYQQNMSIAAAAEQQAQVAKEVDMNLAFVRDLAIQSNEGAKQTRDSSRDLARLAENLNNLVMQFKL